MKKQQKYNCVCQRCSYFIVNIKNTVPENVLFLKKALTIIHCGFPIIFWKIKIYKLLLRT
jgi:hypothetical protein